MTHLHKYEIPSRRIIGSTIKAKRLNKLSQLNYLMTRYSLSTAVLIIQICLSELDVCI